MAALSRARLAATGLDRSSWHGIKSNTGDSTGEVTDASWAVVRHLETLGPSRERVEEELLRFVFSGH